MKNKNIFKLISGAMACFTIVSVGSYAYTHFAKNDLNEEPIIYREVSSYEMKYDFSNNEILAEHADLVVIGKVTELGAPTNYNPTTKKYGKIRTPGNLEVLEIIKNDGTEKIDEIEFMNYGGMLSYNEYSKSLLPAQKAKREYLMKQSGIYNQRSNIFVEQKVKDQLDIEEGNTYVMYLKYDEDFDKYVILSQTNGVKKYDLQTKKVMNHMKNTVETIEELM